MTTPDSTQPAATNASEQHRHHVNLIATAFLLVLALAIAWTVLAFEKQQRLERCFASGRHDCIDIGAPPRPANAVIPPAR